ncbi:MAG TPA: hypothetical protein VE476_12670 [Propionibacteriaceae bacterium]|jgi:hypothetical protein|nr:hypothetical protein [Propionibacteriaceae bacterium]
MVESPSAAARAERVATGLDELDQWLRDQVRTGIAGLGRGGYGPLDRMAARMVDAQAPGVAGMLRGLPGELAGEGWPSRLLEQLGALHLLISAHRRIDDLPADLAATVRSRVGYPVRKADVLAGPGVRDHWFAVGAVDSLDYRLVSRRVWLYGASTRRWALLLSFAPPGGFLDDSVAPGQRLHAHLHFYPGSGQYRALVGEREDVIEPSAPPPPETYAELLERFADLLAADPWATRMPAVVQAAAVPPDRSGGRWRLREAGGAYREVVELAGEPWPLFARSLGEPTPVFGEWGPAGFRPLSLLPDAAGSSFTAVVAAQAA